jgi:hypothetical protein
MWFCLSLTLVTLAMAPDATGQESRKFPKLIPSFDQDRDPPRPDHASSVSRTTFQRVMDKVVPPTRIEKKPRGESAWSKMNRGTKRFFAKTKRALTPWKRAEPAPRETKSGLLPFWSKSDQPKTTSNLFTPLFAKREPTPRPSTVPEWLGRPKP